MLNRLEKFWDDLKGSYWFIPSLMAVAAFITSHLLTTNATYLQQTYSEFLDWIYPTQPDGARIVLSTIAGSMITVAGVTFSITIASVAYATTQYGPRLLTNFMEDRGNQVTLGTFIATFLYCLLVLRTIANADDLSSQQTGIDAAVAFVPHIAVSFGVLMGVASICVFIYFIHHVPASIHASNVIADIGHSLINRIETAYPNNISLTAEADDTDTLKAVADKIDIQSGDRIVSSDNGYIQFLDINCLYKLACDFNATVIINCRPGDYVSQGGCLGWIIQTDKSHAVAQDQLNAAFIIGRKRTPAQDLLFLSTELIEIAARALSPGTNDPFTAMNCMNWLGSACTCLATRRVDKSEILDEHGYLRLFYRHVDFTEFTQLNFNRLSPYAATDRNAALHFVAVTGRIIMSCPLISQKQVVLSLLTPMLKEAETHLCATGREELERRRAILEEITLMPAKTDQTMLNEPWLTGHA